MILFLLLLFPIASIWLISDDLFLIKQSIIDLRDCFLFGILFFIPSLFFINIFAGFLNQTYTVLNIYLYYFFADYFFYQLFSVLSCVLRFRGKMVVSIDEGINHYFLFMAGFYTAFTFYSLIVGYNSTDLYNLFLKPINLLLMAAYASFFLALRDFETGLVKQLFVAALFIFPAISALVPFFFYLRLPLLSFGIIFIMVALGWYIFHKK